MLTKISHFISWHRRVIAAALALTGVLALAAHLSAPPPETVAAVTLRHGVAAGSTITTHDVMLRHLPPEAVPEDALTDVEQARGHSAVVTLSANSVLTTALLREHQAAAPGRSWVPIVIQDQGLRSLLTPGRVVTLILAHSEGTDVITDDALIVGLPPAEEQSGPLASPNRTDAIVVEVPSEVAGNVAALGQQGALSVVLAG